MKSLVKEKNMAEEKNEKEVLPHRYGCEVLLEKTTLDKVKDPYLPNDTYLVWYSKEGKTHMDMVRGSMVQVFDMYYDKYGAGSIEKIDFGYGKMNPKLWRDQQKSTSKKKKK